MNSNKETAVSFLTLVTTGKIREAFENHVGPGFRHHNPYSKGDANSLSASMQESHAKFPNKKFRILQAAAEADRVITHSHVILKPGELELSAVHIFRFENGKILELWDVGQQVPAESPNENGMF